MDQTMTVQQMAEKIVRDEIVCCLSTPVFHLGQIIYSLHCDLVDNLGVTQEELLALNTRYDCEEAARVCISEMTLEELGNFIYMHDVEGIAETDTLAAIRAKCLQRLIDEDELETFCAEGSLDPDMIEVYEHWAVSDWLRQKLGERGEVVGDLWDFNVWGRCTTGQYIYMDDVIQQIAKELLDKKSEAVDA